MRIVRTLKARFSEQIKEVIKIEFVAQQQLKATFNGNHLEVLSADLECLLPVVIVEATTAVESAHALVLVLVD